ncbi:DUF3157 family protein [Carboxylicivirga sp. A043]|uniref:DUF3157 family protein n=1 Tax=Carboxylicivirga litoralis TaxID=2816963 RepID=UPI0021CB4D56|nr:DUF3157 family protein [Carboxylicivirga sp. A043]MCU4156808.1 DUF3157 family protein [Carboxylicivirga sp. A043]
MRYTIILFALLAIAINTNAQTVKAITQHGETVVLFENGTWKYEKDIQQTTPPTTNGAVAAAAPVATTATPEIAHSGINATKEATSEKTEIYNAVSKKLSRFFGEEKGRVRCSATASNNKGTISLNFEFMMQLGDANRYFGYSAKDRTMTLELSDGTSITGTFTEGIEEKFIEKWNVSYYKAGIILSEQDVVKLLQNNTIRMTIDWKKLEEEYQIDNIEGIKQLLIEVI